MVFAEIQHGSPEYRQECELRNTVLRVPLGLSLHDEDLDDEVHQRHFGLFLPDGLLAACAIAVPISPRKIKIRQMAVRPDLQGRGYGSGLLKQVMVHFSARGALHFTLHSRVEASAFYRSLGFVESGEIFTEVGIPHVRMTRQA